MTSAIALPALMDPMYWLGSGGVFGSAVLVGVMVIIFIETGLLFTFLPGDTLLFIAGMIAAQASTPVDIWTLTPCTALAAVLGAQCAYVIGWRGASSMRYSVFVTFSVIGSVLWAVGLPLVGYRLGAMPFVEEHLDLMIVVIACASVVPVIASAAGGAIFLKWREADASASTE
jgi:membrane-associated protein